MNKISKTIIKESTDVPVRLNKYLSDAGFCSRREADRLIEDGKVFINGSAALLGQKVCKDDEVMVNGKIITPNDEMILIAFNKPVGVECTTDSDNPNNIIDCIKYPLRIYPIGRLDKNSSGLILLTNTGEIVNKILKSSNYHEKEYVVKVDRPLTKDFLAGMKNGVEIFLEDGAKKVTTRPCLVEAIDKCSFKIILTQGYNRQIRRMCQTLGYNVISLNRIRIMNINLGNLPLGHYRNVSEGEIKKLLSSLK